MQFLQAHFSAIPMEATKSVAGAARFVARPRTVSMPPRYAYVQGEKLDRFGRSRLLLGQSLDYHMGCATVRRSDKSGMNRYFLIDSLLVL